MALTSATLYTVSFSLGHFCASDDGIVSGLEEQGALIQVRLPAMTVQGLVTRVFRFRV